jgi:transposase
MEGLMAVEAEVGDVVTGRRRYWTVEEKRQIVELTLSSDQSVASLARQHGVNANQVFYWRKLYHAGQLGGDAPADASGLCLLPVSVDSEESSEVAASVEEPDSYESAVPGLTMNIELPGGALVSLAGTIDAGVVRAVLESLRG